jgi:Spy/CpxP family protein refolding chaperone
MMKRRLLVTAALVAVLALTAVPFLAEAAQPPKPNPADILHNPRALARYLKLTAAQIDTMKVLLDNLHATTKPLYDQIEPLEKTLKAQLDVASPDALTVGGTVVRLDALRDKIRDARDVFDAAFSAILTPEQLARYQALKDAARIGEEESAG